MGPISQSLAQLSLLQKHASRPLICTYTYPLERPLRALRILYIRRPRTAEPRHRPSNPQAEKPKLLTTNQTSRHPQSFQLHNPNLPARASIPPALLPPPHPALLPGGRRPAAPDPQKKNKKKAANQTKKKRNIPL